MLVAPPSTHGPAITHLHPIVLYISDKCPEDVYTISEIHKCPDLRWICYNVTTRNPENPKRKIIAKINRNPLDKLFGICKKQTPPSCSAAAGAMP
jgi:hypothetical protein